MPDQYPPLDLTKFGGAPPPLDLSQFGDVAPEPPRGTAAEILAGVKRGFYSAAKGAGAAMQAPAERINAEPGVVSNIGKALEDYSTGGLNNQDNQAQPETHSAATNFLAGAGEATLGAAPMLASGIAGSVAGPVGSAAGAGAETAAQTWHEKYHQALDEFKANNDPDADSKARSVADKSAAFQGALMAGAGGVGGVIAKGGSVLRPLLGGGATTAADAAAQATSKKFLPELAKGAGELTAVNEGLGMAGSAGQAAIDKSAGLKTPTPWEAAKASILPSLESSFGFSPLAALGARTSMMRSRATFNRLSDPAVDHSQRQAAADELASVMHHHNPDAAAEWHQGATDAISNGQPVDMTFGAKDATPVEADTTHVTVPDATRGRPVTIDTASGPMSRAIGAAPEAVFDAASKAQPTTEDAASMAQDAAVYREQQAQIAQAQAEQDAQAKAQQAQSIDNAKLRGEAEAHSQAAKHEILTGQPAEVVPHPTVADKFTVQPKEQDNGNQASKTIAPEAQQPQASATNRRLTTEERRARYSSMSADELRKELDETDRRIHTSHLTGLKNKAAYESDARLPVQVFADIDGLKPINDTLGHPAGDSAIKAMADALAKHTDHAYHLSGDEFVVQANSDAEAHQIMNAARDDMMANGFAYEDKNGKPVTKKGTGFSYGIGTDFKSAEQNQYADKADRKARGLRFDRPAEGVAPVGAEISRPAQAEARTGHAGDVGAGKERLPDPRVDALEPTQTPAPAGVSVSDAIKPAVEQLIKRKAAAGQLKLAPALASAINKAKEAMRTGTGNASDFTKSAKLFEPKKDKSGRVVSKGDEQIRTTLLSIADALKPTQTTQKSQKKSTSLLPRLRQLGGVNISHLKDITGEAEVRKVGAVGVFSKNGRGLDDLATTLADEGFPINTHDVDGGVQQLRDMINDALHGNAVLTHAGMDAKLSAGQEAEHRDGITKQAKELGIKTVGRKFGDVEADVLNALKDQQAAIEDNLSDEDARKVDDLMMRLQNAIGDDDADKIFQEVTKAYKDKPAKEYYDALANRFTEALNEHETDNANRGAENGSGENAAPSQTDEFRLEKQTPAEIKQREDAARNAQQAEDQAATQRAVEHERNQPLSLTAQTQDRAEGATSQGQMFTPDGRASESAETSSDKLSKWLDNVAKKLEQEGWAQDVIDTMQEHGESPEHVAKTFWGKTYQTMPEQGKKLFKRLYKGHAGQSLEEGDNPMDMIDLGDKAEYLQDTDRGFVALMREANKQHGANRIEQGATVDAKPNTTTAISSSQKSEPIAPNSNGAAKPSQSVAKEPWQMTRGELIERQVARNAGKIEVLQTEYDDLLSTAPDVSRGNLTRKSGHDSSGLNSRTKWDEKNRRILDGITAQISKLKAINVSLRTNEGKEKAASFHNDEVRKAVEQGKPVPAEVLADYPDLKPSQEPKAEQPASGEAGKIDDLGEKIGGARKDTAISRGGRVTKESTDTAENDATWRKRFEAVQMNEQVDQPWLILDKKTHRFVKNGYRDQEFSSKEAAEKVIPLAAVALKHRVVMTSRGDETPVYEIWRDVTDRKRIAVVPEKFSSREDAMKYMAEHAADIIETKTSFGEEILPKPETVQRIGAVRRKGDVVGKDFMDAFGFRGVEFGNWNNQEERQDVLNHAYDGLLDLAEVLNIPPKAISLNGDLALAFGARGQGLSGARAHYERNRAVINLTKMSGAGALAHEWLHSLDHYLGRADRGKTEMTAGADGHKTFGDANQSDFASHGFAYNSKLRAELRDAYKELIDTMFYKAEKYVEDTQKAEEWLGRSRDALQEKLDAIRKNLSEQRNQEYYKRNNKPASAEQLAKFDELAEQLIEGKDLGVRAHFDETKRVAGRMNTSMRMSNETLEAMNSIIKDVRGRSGFNAAREGWLDSIRTPMSNYQERIRMLGEARNATEKTKRVPTDYRKDAKEIDQGRASDYWATEHEMAARAFSSYVEDKLAEKGNRSDFLSYGSKGRVPAGAFGWVRPFPSGEERVAINKAFDKFFKTIQAKETDKGVALFSKSDQSNAERGQTIKSVQQATTALRNNWRGFRNINTVKSVSDLPDELRQRAMRSGGIASDTDGLYDPKTKAVYLVADNIASPDRAAWVAIHEVVGHGGIRMLGKPVADVLNMAGKNRFVAYLAKAIATDRGEDFNAKLHTDEAIAELAAAKGTDNFKELSDRYGVDAPLLVRNGARAAVARVIEAVRQFIAKVMGKPAGEVSDAQIHELLGAMRKKVEGNKSVFEASVSPLHEPALASISKRELALNPHPGAGMIDSIKSTVSRMLTESGLDKAVHDVQLAATPMATGSDTARKITKDYANIERLATHEWHQIDKEIQKNFTEAQQVKMWEAADEENDLRRDGKTSDTQGLNRLNTDERAMVEKLHDYGEQLMTRARSTGMFQGEGVPYWTPRMAVMVGEDGEYARPAGGRGGSKEGSNISDYSSSLQKRKYLTAAETEAAMKARLDAGDKTAELVKNIRTMPMAMARVEKAIAARELINQVKAIGKLVGKDTVTGEAKPEFFTLDHPAFKTFKPKFIEQDGKMVAAVDQNGDTVFEQAPLFVSKEFEGPLKAIMSTKNSTPYNWAMQLKSKSMGLIMYSPMIHNAVEWGRAYPAMDWKGKLSLGAYTYLIGNKAKNDHAVMREAIDNGLVPIGGRGNLQDITGIAAGPSLEVGKSWTAKALAAPVALMSEKGALNVKKAVDAAGKFWHETLLWDRVGDLQMGLYTTMKDSLINKGLSEFDAGHIAAHEANRFAGAMPNEAMSANARKLLNLALFSRTFTTGNLGVMKDMITGLPKDVQAQIKMNSGAIALQAAKSQARKIAIATVVTDIGLMYLANGMLQAYLNPDDKSTIDDRLTELGKKFNVDPVSVLTHPFNSLESLTPGSMNEPGKEERIKWGKDSTGTEIYARQPAGKIGEEFGHYMDFPSGTLKQLHSKMSTMLKPLVDTALNDTGVGQKVYDDSKDASLAKNIGNVVMHFMKAQVPTDQIMAAYDTATGHGDDMDIKKLVGPLAGVTFSKGAAGGPEVGMMYAASRDYQDKVASIMPDVKRALKLVDQEEAIKLMRGINMPQQEINKHLRTIESPQTRLNPVGLRKFNQHATDEEKYRMQNINH